MDMPRAGRSVKVIIYVSRPPPKAEGTKETEKEVKVRDVVEGNLRTGRPKTQSLVDSEFQQRVGAMTVGVCGPGAFADDVRAAARGVVTAGNVNFWEEAFTW